MGIFGALTTAVGGLRANSYALENVSGNIANSQTTAFKRIDTSFLDLIPQTALTAQLAGGVTTQSRSTNSVQGDVQSASVATFMAINGNGFFAVQKPGTFTDGTPVFDGSTQQRNAQGVSLSTFRPEDLSGIEYYAGPSGVPARYTGMNADCGTLLFWTREP